MQSAKPLLVSHQSKQPSSFDRKMVIAAALMKRPMAEAASSLRIDMSNYRRALRRLAARLRLGRGLLVQNQMKRNTPDTGGYLGYCACLR